MDFPVGACFVVDLLGELFCEVFEAFSAITRFQRWGECFDASGGQRFLEGSEHFAGIPESVDKHDERRRRFC